MRSTGTRNRKKEELQSVEYDYYAITPTLMVFGCAACA
jgi:hypothetical protein